MYQVGDHFNKHGRAMGYASKKEYEAGAKKFFEDRLNDSSSKLYSGLWDGSGKHIQNKQFALVCDGKTLIFENNRIITWYSGTEMRGLTNLEILK